MNWVLLGISGAYKGLVLRFMLERQTIGRDEKHTIFLHDELVSRDHCAYWLKDGRPHVQDLNTRNGVFIDDVPQAEADLEEGSRLKCGSTTFLCLLEDDVPADPSDIFKAESERNRRLETLRADYAVRAELTIRYRSVTKTVLEIADSSEKIRDMEELQAHFLELDFDMMPARRGAILVNGKHVSPDPSDFVSKIYRESGSPEDAPFTPDGRILEYVYEKRLPKFSPAAICVPIFVEGAMRGVIYMETSNTQEPFEPEHLRYLQFTSYMLGLRLRFTADIQTVRIERDVLRAERPTEVEMVGESEAMQKVWRTVEAAAGSDVPVLIVGETGTGKELIARLIHQLSPRYKQPLVAVNCAAIVDTLFESEFMGHTRSAYTGAMEAEDGKFKQADGGTLFLDELGSLKLDVQAKFLRVLQEKKFQPVGGKTTIEVDVRVISATNNDLEEAIANKTFRPDLFFRLNAFIITVPPLRERPEDIPLLVRHFLDKYGQGEVTGIAADALAVMVAYHWPGNVRELEGLIGAGVACARAAKINIIRMEDLPERVTKPKASAAAAAAAPVPAALPPSPSWKKKATRQDRKTTRTEAKRIYKETGSASETARILGFSASYLYRLLGEEDE